MGTKHIFVGDNPLRYPEKLQFCEMTLVRMLQDQRSWNDYCAISDALANIQRQANSMREERDHLAVNTMMEANSEIPRI